MATGDPTAPTRDHSLATSLKVGWGLGSIGTQIVLNGQSLLLLYYFVSVIGMEPALAGTLLFGAKLFDAALAPIVGSWSDRTDTRWGRRRPFLVAGALLCGAGLAFIFNPPSTHPLVLLAALMVISVGYSLFNIPYITMPAEMTDSPAERTSIMSWRIAFVGLGTMVATSVLPLLVKHWGGGAGGYALMGMVAAGLTAGTMLVTFAMTSSARATQSMGEPFSMADMVNAVVSNRPFAFLLLAKLLQLVGLAAMSASIFFFFKQVLAGGESTLAIWGLVANGVSIASMLFWPRVSRRFGKVPVYCATVFGYSLFGFSWLLAGPDTEMWAVILRAIGGGVFAGGLSLMGQSILPDTIAVDHARTGLRREGVFAGAYSFVEKASFALGPMLVGFIFQIMGYATHGSLAGDTRAIYLAVGVVSPLAYALSIVPLLALGRALTAYQGSSAGMAAAAANAGAVLGPAPIR
jgi:glycoside/pentoside/hexuronide:cation symporter, GPH family